MVCAVKGCKNDKEGGWIDMFIKNDNDTWVKAWFCEDHFQPIFNKINELIEQDRKDGKLEKNSFYAVVPFHIASKVLNFKED